MKTLRSFAIIAGLAVGALGSTAAAQPHGRYGHHAVSELENRLDRVAVETQRGIRAGRLDARDARWLRGRIDQVAHRFEMFSSDGYSRSERRELAQRISTLEQGLRARLPEPRYSYYDRRR